jgi:hypothetical protein
MPINVIACGSRAQPACSRAFGIAARAGSWRSLGRLPPCRLVPPTPFLVVACLIVGPALLVFIACTSRRWTGGLLGLNYFKSKRNQSPPQ